VTTLNRPPFYDIVPKPAPPSRWRRLLLGSGRRKTALAAGTIVLLVAGLLGASYETSPGGTLWGVEKTVFPGHAQDVALAAVVSDLKTAQGILGSGQQPTPDQLTDARTSLNQAKQDLDYLSPSPEQAGLQNLYLQLTQQLLQYTPDSVQQLPPLPVPPAVDPGNAGPTPDAAAASAPTWGYPVTDDAGTAAPDDYAAPPPDADWPQPDQPVLTANLADLGYYDPTWGPLYGYDSNDWYNYDLSGYNQYGFDFLGFDRWGYDRWGFDRWGYDHRGYGWGGYNGAGYDRGGWDRGGRNEWGQHRGRPGDPRNQDWYNIHHPYAQYYQRKFQHDDPVYRRTQWNQAHGFHPDQYQNWNVNRDWHNPRDRDWAPLASAVGDAKSAANLRTHASSPVVNLNASLSQFISNDKATRASGSLMKDLAGKSTRDFTRDLVGQSKARRASLPTLDTGRPSAARHQTSAAPPALTAPAPRVAPSKVAPGFTAPKLAPVPAYKPPTAAKPHAEPGRSPADRAPGAVPDDSSAQSPGARNPAAAPRGANPAPREQVPPPQKHSAAPDGQSPQQQRAAPEPPSQRAPESAPKASAPARQAPAPVRQAPEPRASTPAPARRAPAPQRPARQAPARQAPARQARPAAPRAAPAPRQAPAPRGGQCSGPRCPR
jgi:hypothetical protein